MTSNFDSQTEPPSSPNPLSRLSWGEIKARARELIRFLPEYLKNPVEGIKRVPAWDWPTVILLEILLSATTGALTGIVARHFLSVIGGLILAPIVGLVLSFVVAGILYYACLFIMRTEVEFRRVFVIVVLAKIPSQILGIFSPIMKFITLVSIVVTALLLIKGMVENFMLEQKKVVQVVGGLAAVTLLFWLYSMVMEITTHHIKVQDYTPDSLDQIHKELNDSK